MKSSVRTKLVASFLVVIAVTGLITVWLGVHLIGDETIKRAQDKVRMDLNSAREVYGQRLRTITEVVRLTAIRFFLKESLITGNPGRMEAELRKILETEHLDVLTVTDSDGRIILRAGNPEVRGDSQVDDEIVSRALLTGEVIAATQIVPREELAKEQLELAAQAYMEFVPTPMARPRSDRVETSGMMMKAAAPIFDYDGDLIGVIYGARLINRNYEIVDTVKEIVYQGETYRGRDVGSVTIFQGDLRISTNVLNSQGQRAIGTRVSKEVYDEVVVKGKPWVARAFVVNDWYITAYEPLRNLEGDVIGMLYVGMLEAPYADLKKRIILSFSGIAVTTIIILSVVLYATTSDIVKPLKELLHATERIAKGYLSHRVEVTSDDELGQLAKSFNSMTTELQKATDDYRALTQTLEDKVIERTRQLDETRNQLIQSEKLASLGKMAAGIAHEINNPLTSVLLNSHLIAERLADKADIGENLRLIIDETARCSEIVKGLLAFSRQTPPEKRPTDVNRLIEDTMLLLKSNVLESRVEVRRYLGDDLPRIMLDGNKIKQVFTNIVLNALEAMPDGGTLSITSRIRSSPQGRWLDTEFEDTGCGIPEGVLPKIFDPFFSTKATKGTGLGLSVSYGIIEQHGGRIEVRSRVGEGTTVTVVLPASELGKRTA